MTNSASSDSLPIKGVLCYCRSGYEQNLAQELEEVCAQSEVFGYAKIIPQTGYVYFSLFDTLHTYSHNLLITRLTGDPESL